MAAGDKSSASTGDISQLSRANKQRNQPENTPHPWRNTQRMPGSKNRRGKPAQRSLTNYLLHVREQSRMSQDGAQPDTALACTQTTASSPEYSTGDSEYNMQLTKADFDDSLTNMYDKIARKFQSELHKSTNTLSLKIATLGTRTDLLETKDDDLAHSNLRKDNGTFTETVQLLQAHLEDPDNRNLRHNLMGVPETVTDLLRAMQTLFQSLLPESPLAAFTSDRIHRALRPKPPPERPPRDIVLCLKDFLIKEEILRASRNMPHILLEGITIQKYTDISPTTLDKRRRMKEITTVLQSARITYQWGFPFKLQVPHNGTTYTVTTILEGKDLLVKLGLLDAADHPRMPYTQHPSAIWATPSPRRERRNQH